MSTVLHHIPGARSFRILWLLQEMQITPTVKTYKIQDGPLRGGFRRSKSTVKSYTKAARSQSTCAKRGPNSGLAGRRAIPNASRFSK